VEKLSGTKIDPAISAVSLPTPDPHSTQGDD